MEINYILGKKIKVSENTLKYRGSFLDNQPYDVSSLTLFYNLIKDIKDAILLDVGACTGSYTLLPTLKRDLKVYSFEPSRTFLELIENIKLNNVDASAYNIAISNYDGKGEFNEIVDDGTIALSILGGTPSSHKNCFKKEITVRKLDSLCQELNIIPSAIKIDVEGNELSVLSGVQDIITRYHPIIFCEHSQENTNQYGYSEHEIYNFLVNNGYSVEVKDTDLIAVYKNN